MGSGSSTSQKNTKNTTNTKNTKNTILDIETPSNIPLLPTDISDRSDKHTNKSSDINKNKSKNNIKYLDDKYKSVQDK